MELLDLYAKIGIDDKEYNKGINSAESKAKKLGKGLKSAFKIGASAIGVTVAAMAGLTKVISKNIKETAAYGDTIDKQSQRVGLSAEAYQKWDYVLKIAGTEMSNMRIGLKTMTNQLDKAKNGSEEAQANFAKLGISMDELNNLSREEAFEKVIKGFQGMEDSTERAALANKMFGRSGQELTPLFNQSAEATDELIRKAEDYGMIMSNEAVKASAEFTDSMTTLQQTATGLKNRLMGDLLPAVTQITDGLALMFTRDGQDEGLEKFNKGITDTINNIGDLIPKILDIGVPIIENIATSIIDNLPKLASTKLASTAVNVIVNLATFLIDSLPDILKIGIQIIMALVQGISDNAEMLITTLVSAVLEMIKMLTDPNMLLQLLDVAFKLIMALENGLIEALPLIYEAMPTIISNIAEFLKKGIPMLIDAAIVLFNAIVDAIPVISGVLSDAIPEIIDIIISFLTGDAVPLLLDGAVQLFMALVDALPVIAGALLQGLGTLLSSLFQPIGDFFVNIWNSIVEFFANIWAKIVEFFQPLIDFISPIFEALHDLFSSVFGAIKDIVTGVMKKIKDKFIKPIIEVKERIKIALDGIKAKFKEALLHIIQIVGKPIHDLKEKLVEPINNFKDKVKEIKDKVKSWGSDMIEGFRKGITDKIQKLKDSLLGILDWIKERFHFSLPEKGPLAQANLWMPDFMDLMAKGIDDNKFKVLNALDGLSNDMTISTDYADGSYIKGYGAPKETVQKFEFGFAEGRAPLLQIARLLFPYMRMVEKEVGV